MSETGFYLLPTNKLYQKENTKKLKNFPAGYVGNFYRNLSDRVDNVQSNFLSAISNDTAIPKDDVQKYLLATSDFAKSIQTDINHYVTRDRINNASFRQKLDLISRNIIRRQNPLELVFEDISTFDSENPIVNSLLREVDYRKKQTDSDFIKSLPSQPGKEFEIKKRLDKLRGTATNNFNNNNNSNVNPGGGGINISGLGPPPTLPKIEDLTDNGPEVTSNVFLPPPPPPPPSGPVLNPFVVPKIDEDGPIDNNIFGSIGTMMGPRSKENKNDKNEIDDFLYELADNFPTLELGDKLLDTLGNVGEEVLADDPTKKNEEDTILQDIIDEYNIPDMKNTMDETGEVPKNIYFFYGGESEGFVRALEFLGISPENREFAACLLSDLGRKTMTQNKLRIHVDSGDIFYDNHNTEENFYSFLLSQQNEEAAFVPKRFSYSNTFEKYITSFLQNFSIDDQEKFDMLAFKNSKYLFYRFNDFVKMYGNPRYKLLHTRKMKDSTTLKKLKIRTSNF